MWSIVWFCLVRNCPAEDKLMSSQERRFLIHVNQHHSREKVISFFHHYILLGYCCYIYVIRILSKGDVSVEKNSQVQAFVGLFKRSFRLYLVIIVFEVLFASVCQRYVQLLEFQLLLTKRKKKIKRLVILSSQTENILTIL